MMMGARAIFLGAVAGDVNSAAKLRRATSVTLAYLRTRCTAVRAGQDLRSSAAGRRRWANSGGPDLAGIGVAREVGACSRPDFKATRNRKVALGCYLRHEVFVHLSTADCSGPRAWRAKAAPTFRA
jgi:hypothetical protein